MDSLSPAFRNAGFWTGLFLADETLLKAFATGAAYDDEFFVSHFSSFCFSLGPYEYANKRFSILSRFCRLVLFKNSMLDQKGLKQIALVILSFRLMPIQCMRPRRCMVL